MTLVVNLLPVSTILVANLPPISKTLAVNFPTGTANKFRKSQIQKSANLRTYKICYICGPYKSVAICKFAIFWAQYFICNLRTQFFIGLKT
jgi:hypothetical protein